MLSRISTEKAILRKFSHYVLGLSFSLHSKNFFRDLIQQFEYRDPDFLRTNFAIKDCFKLLSFFIIKFSLNLDVLDKITTNLDNRNIIRSAFSVMEFLLSEDLLQRENKSKDENANFFLTFFLLLGIFRGFWNLPTGSHLNKERFHHFTIFVKFSNI